MGSPKKLNNKLFINCPFDKDYFPFYQRLVFILTKNNFSLFFSSSNSLKTTRIDNIKRLISKCKYSIHDLSRNKSNSANEYSRLNMPLELGIDIGCATWFKRNKIITFLVDKKHSHNIFISDLSGYDPIEHNNDPESLFDTIPVWLSKINHTPIITPQTLRIGFNKWHSDSVVIFSSWKKEGDTRDVDMTLYYQTLLEWNKKVKN